MKTPGTWQPLLAGELAARARQAVLDIAASLKEPGERTAADPTLASGSAGIALFHTCLAEALGDEIWAEAAASHYDRMVESVADAPLQPGLFSGLVGIGWTIEHLAGRLFAADEEDDANREIDATLLPALVRPWMADYDLIRGLAGIGVYLWERLPRPEARKGLRAIVVQLVNSVERRDGGLTWHTPPALLPPSQRELFPQGYFNLGVAHGVPGVIALLGLLREADPGDEEARSLLDGAVAWLLAQELPAGAPSRFPSFVSEGVAPAPSRLAWCYGDLGIAVSLLGAARRAGNATWEREALRIALAAAGRSPDSSGIIDPGLCHGAAGAGHLFHRLHQATGEERLAEAARFWFRRTLDLQRPGEGVAGFLAWSPKADGGGSWDDDPAFLTGAAGVGLALLAAISEAEPAWDRPLMATIPPRS